MSDKIPSRNQPESTVARQDRRGRGQVVRTEDGWCALESQDGMEMRTCCGANLDAKATVLTHGQPDCFACLGIIKRDAERWLVVRPEPVERRPDPMPTNPKPPSGDTAVEPPPLPQQAMDAVVSIAETFTKHFVEQLAAHKNTVGQLLAKLERIPCMCEDCFGIGDGEPVTKDCPAPTRCHRCEAVRLARSAMHG